MNQKACCPLCRSVEIIKDRPLTAGGGYPVVVCRYAACKCHIALCHSPKPESEWSEFDARFVTGNVNSLWIQHCEAVGQIKTYISANYVSKKRIKEVIEGKIQSGYHASNVLVVLSDIKQDLLGND